MPNEEICLDLYGERLNIGDEVIPVMDEALINGISGIISKIQYKQYRGYAICYITITDKDGNVLLDDMNARCYTTQKRFDEREAPDHVYSLTFYNNICWALTSLPLTNKTNPNYEFPEGTTFIALDAKHMNCKSGSLSSDIYVFASKDKVTFGYYENNGVHYLQVLETGQYQEWIPKNHKQFETDEQLSNYIRTIIQFFNSADLTHVNNDYTCPQNLEGKKFEKTLLGFLK